MMLTFIIFHFLDIAWLYGGIVKYFQKNIPQGASTTCFLALNPKAKEFSGEYFVDNNVAKVSGYAKDAELAKKLWEFGMELTASKWFMRVQFYVSYVI